MISPTFLTRRALAAIVLLLSVTGCAVSQHALQPSELGTPRSSNELVALMDTPGPVQLETVVSADWAVDRSGLINLEHPRSKAAGLTSGDEPIQVVFHVLRHPTRGVYIVDTGVERAIKASPETAATRGMVASYMKLETMRVRRDLASWLEAEPAPLAGVFLTHLHLDHVMGLPDVPRGTPIFAGPGETAATAFTNLFVRPIMNRAFEGHAALREWVFSPDASGRFDGAVDIFGDGSVWALWVPGHTPGSTAYLVRTPGGPVLLTGDACHTAWGWEHDVEPGEFSADKLRSGQSLARLRQLAAEHPGLDVRLGHQLRGTSGQPTATTVGR